MNGVSLAKLGLIAAGIMLGLETLIGCVAALGIGFEPLPIMLGLALTMGFPVYLLSLRSLRGAPIGLWALFVYRWAVTCCLSGLASWLTRFGVGLLSFLFPRFC